MSQTTPSGADVLDILRAAAKSASPMFVCCGDGVQTSDYDPPECCGQPYDDTDMANAIAAVAALIAERDALATENSALREALQNIAGGNLGDAPWQANYKRIRAVADAALALTTAKENDDG